MKNRSPAPTFGKRKKIRQSLSTRFRNALIAGFIVIAPIFITAYVVWSVIVGIDGFLVSLFPQRIAGPIEAFPIPGLGIAIMILGVALFGAVTANFVGRKVILFGESVFERMPVIRGVYNVVKQILETVAPGDGHKAAFSQTAMIEWPCPGSYAIAFVTAEAAGEIKRKISGAGGAGDDAADDDARKHDGEEDKYISVFMPTTPNPTSGFLIYASLKRVKLLEMSPDHAAKLIMSAGIIADKPDSATPESGDAKATDRASAAAPPSSA